MIFALLASAAVTSGDDASWPAAKDYYQCVATNAEQFIDSSATTDDLALLGISNCEYLLQRAMDDLRTDVAKSPQTSKLLDRAGVDVRAATDAQAESMRKSAREMEIVRLIQLRAKKMDK
jgi:hypothetical protein